jgi:hypothetical protein
VSDPQQPNHPSWWVPSGGNEPSPNGGNGFAPLEDTREARDTNSSRDTLRRRAAPDSDVRQPEGPLPPAPAPPTGTGPGTAPPPPYSYPPPYQPYQPYAPAPTTNGLAVASLVCGIVSMVGGLACLIGAAAAIPGLIMGLMALSRIGRSGGQEKGKGMAIAGIVTSGVGIVVLFLFIVWGIANTVDQF